MFLPIAALALLVAVLSPAGAPVAAPQEAPVGATPLPQNLVVVTLDTVRADRLGCYGYFRDTTPNLDRFAADALRFTRCQVPIAQTTPSHTSLFTGVGPFEHGVTSNHARRPQEERAELGLETGATLRTLAESFAARGYATGGFVTATPVKRFTGLAAGFAEWSEPTQGRRIGREAIRDALAFLDRTGERPRFLWVHLFDAHEPYVAPTPPKSFLEKYASEPRLLAWLAERGFPEEVADLAQHGRDVVAQQNLYDGALRFMDQQLGVLLERLAAEPLRSTTTVVLVADHGTALGQHDHVGHGICWDEQLRVPLLIRVPGVAPALHEMALSTLDLWPTVAALAPGLLDPEWLRQCRGSDVLAVDHESRPLFAISGRQGSLASVTAGRFKLIRDERGDSHLFDLEADPHEQRDVAADHPQVVAALRRQVDAEVERQKRAHALHRRGSEAGAIDPKLLEELRELGYVGADAGVGDGGR
ncbi:MAG: sulfatase [Planctomycetes bacterium]|nr:sulfatase [Planctomycetota bacterium]